MNIIDLDKPLYMDPRPFLKFAYLDVKKKDKMFKTLEDSGLDEASYWNEIIDVAIKEKAGFANCSTFVRGDNKIQLRGIVDLLDEEGNVVVAVPLHVGFVFHKDGQSYFSFGPFIASVELRKFKINESDSAQVETDLVEDLEYLEV